MDQLYLKAFCQIEARKNHLLAKLKKLDSKTLRAPQSTGKWSVIQVLVHLLESESGSLKYCQKKIKAGEKIPGSSVLERPKFWFYLWILRSRVKFNAPRTVSNPSNEIEFVEIVEKWRVSRNELKEFLEKYPDKFLNKAIYKHPFAGRVRLEEMLVFFDAHMQHHEYQIRRILSAIG